MDKKKDMKVSMKNAEEVAKMGAKNKMVAAENVGKGYTQLASISMSNEEFFKRGQAMGVKLKSK